ncbi:hypothetical protein [Streptomyces sp. NPDC008125]|uniref:hypothetical protein n=1 Tax=Streptomyces sp. NPDC008125 TaxID=3364811 RepID=UPI0036EAA7A2
MANYRRRQRVFMGAALALVPPALWALLTGHTVAFALLLVASVVMSQASEGAYRLDRLARTPCCHTWASSSGRVHGQRCPYEWGAE